MKTILTLIFVLFVGVAAQAQSSNMEVKVEIVEIGVATETVPEEVKLEPTTEVARLYKFKNSKIKKALSFVTKRNNAKLV